MTAAGKPFDVLRALHPYRALSFIFHSKECFFFSFSGKALRLRRQKREGRDHRLSLTSRLDLIIHALGTPYWGQKRDWVSILMFKLLIIEPFYDFEKI